MVRRGLDLHKEFNFFVKLPEANHTEMNLLPEIITAPFANILTFFAISVSLASEPIVLLTYPTFEAMRHFSGIMIAYKTEELLVFLINPLLASLHTIE